MFRVRRRSAPVLSQFSVQVYDMATVAAATDGSNRDNNNNTNEKQ